MEPKLSLNIKENNRNRVFNLLRTTGGMSKPGVARELGLSVPTAIQHIKELEDMGVIKEGESVGYTGGRKAKSYIINEDYRYALGIEIALDEMIVAAVDFNGEQKNVEVIRIPFKADNDYYKKLGSVLEERIDRWEIDREKIIGVGVAVPGLVTEDYSQVYYGKARDNFTGTSVREVGRYIPYPCQLYNNSDAAGVAEIACDERGSGDAVLIRLGEDVGGAVMIGGQIYGGENSKSGKIGHLQMIRGGKVCHCGRRGCLNTVCNTEVLEEACGGTVEDFFEKLESGEEKCAETWEDYLQYLAEGIANVRMLFDSQVIVGGMMAEYIEPYFQELTDRVAVLDTFDNPRDYLKLSCVKRIAPALGGALWFLHEFWKDF